MSIYDQAEANDWPNEVSYELVDLSDLRIPGYQREDPRELRGPWSVRAAGALVVSRRDGALWLVDGQRRATLARRTGIERLPASVLLGLDESGEAKVYLDYNAERLAVNAIEQHKARVMAGDKRAIAIDVVLAEHQLAVTRSSRGVDGRYPFNAITQAEKIYDDGGSELLHRSLCVIEQAWPDQIRRPPGWLVRGVGYFLARDPWEANDSAVVGKLAQVSAGRLRELAAHARELAGGGGHGGGSPIHTARGVAVLVYGSRGAEWTPRHRRGGGRD